MHVQHKLNTVLAVINLPKANKEILWHCYEIAKSVKQVLS